jgi:hypothetical protein
MPNPETAIPTSPFASILAWSANWPDWQRDALRRIVGAGKLSNEDLAELAAICRFKHGLPPATGAAPIANPLTSAHTPGGADGSASISLSKLSGLQNVGRLPSDQEIAFGAAPGLTVIYGENGAGKSGYARVIKKACRARGTPQEIKPDAFASAATGPAKAQISFRVGTVETPVDWTDGGTTDPRLGNIFVFDSFSARVHVGEDGPACFKPRGLDVLPELARACDWIGGELRKALEAIAAENAKTSQGWNRGTSTKIGVLVNAIGATTKPETIDAAAVFTDADEKRLTEVTATLSTDPKLKAAETAAAANRIRTFAESAKGRATSVDDTAMQTLGDSIKAAETTAKAAKAAAGPETKSGELPWGDNDVWRELWKAAQKFSEESAYPGQTFPVTVADAKCVLCQQSLQPEAVERYARFNKFVADETRKRASAAKAKVADLKKGVDLLRAIGGEAANIKADLDREAAGTHASVETFANAVDARIVHAQKCLKDGTWSDAPVLPASPCEELLILATTLDSRATAEAATADPFKRKEAETERDELTDRKWLKGMTAEVKAQIARLDHVAKLKKCQEDCIKNTITRKSGELEATFVTEKFHAAFKAELKELGMAHVRVQLEEARPEPGTRRHGLRLEGSPRKANGDAVHNPKDILSEGEQRCAALAVFMAELTQASHKSALVFDDPVSSLDHARRAKVAKRLVKEAAERQVVVFTHDVVFLCEFFDATENAGSPVEYMNLCWSGETPGFCQPGLPWDWKKYTDRIDALEKEQRRIASSWSTVPNPSNVADIRMAYTHLSATLERVVQDLILNDVIGRYRGWVKVERIKEVVGFSDSECEALLKIEKKCSDVTCRHDPAAAKDAPVPDPVEFLQDLNALKSLVEQVKSRRRTAKASSSSASVGSLVEAKPASLPVSRV